MNRIYLLIALLIMAAWSASGKKNAQGTADKALIDKVAHWQITHLTDTFPNNHWTRAALYRGMVEWAEHSGSQSIYDFLVKVGESCNWNLLPRVYDADDLCMSQTYLRLYKKYKNPKMLENPLQRVLSVISKPMTMGLDVAPKGKYNRERWGWCDALFMAPPVYAQLAEITNDPRLLDFAFSEYKVTTDSLYNPLEKLFYRDLRWVGATESSGKKLFWGRGNGWVYASLPQMLALTPKTHSSYNYYLNLYLQMSEAILACQDNNGSWHTSMLDAKSYPEPENSASGFFVYGMAWGVNHGILKEKKYKDAAVKGWAALKKYVDAEGKLGYVQPIGHAPFKNLTAEMTATYGVGAFLLAGAEMYQVKR
jgi:rhamnogalacturonyl hydrolase YesR